MQNSMVKVKSTQSHSFNLPFSLFGTNRILLPLRIPSSLELFWGKDCREVCFYEAILPHSCESSFLQKSTDRKCLFESIYKTQFLYKILDIPHEDTVDLA